MAAIEPKSDERLIVNNSNNGHSNEGTFWKAMATVATCVMLIAALALSGTLLAPQMGDEALGAVFMVMAGAIVINGFVWNWGATGQRKLDRKAREAAEDELYDYASNVGEKRKRDRLAVALSQLSDGELVSLKTGFAMAKSMSKTLQRF
jgi:hypothetical protein